MPAPSRAVLSLALPLLASNAVATADAVIPVSQSCSAFADSFVVLGPIADQDLVDVLQPGVAPFSIAFDTHASLANGTATFDLAHDSELLPFGFVAEGWSRSTSTIVRPGGFCYSVGSSSATVTFSVAADTAFRLGAALAGGANGQTKLTLSGPGGAVLSKSLTGAEESVRMTGILPAGTWTLHVFAFASTSLGASGAMSDESSFRMFLSTSPSAADLDLDGTVNAADLGLLLGSWGPCDACNADIDGDGVVNAADLAALLGDWS